MAKFVMKFKLMPKIDQKHHTIVRKATDMTWIRTHRITLMKAKQMAVSKKLQACIKLQTFSLLFYHRQCCKNKKRTPFCKFEVSFSSFMMNPKSILTARQSVSFVRREELEKEFLSSVQNPPDFPCSLNPNAEYERIVSLWWKQNKWPVVRSCKPV